MLGTVDNNFRLLFLFPFQRLLLNFHLEKCVRITEKSTNRFYWILFWWSVCRTTVDLLFPCHRNDIHRLVFLVTADITRNLFRRHWTEHSFNRMNNSCCHWLCCLVRSSVLQCDVFRKILPWFWCVFWFSLLSRLCLIFRFIRFYLLC